MALLGDAKSGFSKKATLERARAYLKAQGYDAPPATVYQDNQAATRLSESGVASSARARRVDARRFFIQDRVDDGDAKAERLSAKSVAADCLTKPLAGELLYKPRDLLLGYAALWSGRAKSDLSKKAPTPLPSETRAT